MLSNLVASNSMHITRAIVNDEYIFMKIKEIMYPESSVSSYTSMSANYAAKREILHFL